MLFGILGLGSIGDRHARNLMNLGHQVIFHDPGMLGSRPRDEVLKLADAVIICTPTKEHFRDLCDAMHANCHVLVEKPIGYDCPPLLSGFMMGANMKNPHLKIATGFMCRFHPVVQQAKRDIENGMFGRLQSAQFSVLQRNNKPDYLRDGVIRNWLSHELDLARYLLGNLYVDKASCHLNSQGQDIAATVNCAALDNSEIPVSIMGDYVTTPYVRQFTILGERRAKNYKLEIGQDIWDQTYVDEMKAFINKIEGKPFGPLADGADGIASLELVMEALGKANVR